MDSLRQWPDNRLRARFRSTTLETVRYRIRVHDHSIRANSKLPQGGRKTAEFCGFSERRNLEIFQFHPQNSQYFFHNLWTGDGLGHRILLFPEPEAGNHSFKTQRLTPRLQTANASGQLAEKSAGNTVVGTGTAHYAIDVVRDAK